MVDAGVCVAPKCPDAAVRPSPFCAVHSSAPQTKRAGWLSAAKRRFDTVRVDASNVAPKLWVGGFPPVDVDLPKIDLLVLCAAELQPERLAFHGRVARCPLPDAELSMSELRRAAATSSIVAAALLKQQRVLVTCALGINRSALVAALALGQVTMMSADEIIELVRRRRNPRCLENSHFRDILQQLIGAGREKKRSPTRRTPR